MLFRVLILPAVLTAAAAGVLADADVDVDDFRRFRSEPNSEIFGKFTFVRVEYDSCCGAGNAWYNYDGRTWFRWETDYPEAETNFLYRLSELTTAEPNPKPIVRRLTDPDIFNYPFIYMCDVGWMELSRKEVKSLREYMLRGGFVWVDDFWGKAEWDSLERAMEEVFPENRWRAIPNDHPILQSPFKLESCPQVPARDFASPVQHYDPPGIHKWPTGGDAGVNTVNFRGWFDDEDRLMMVATHNTDIGDGWEREAEGEWYFRTFSTTSYAMGINIIVYAMTH